MSSGVGRRGVVAPCLEFGTVASDDFGKKKLHVVAFKPRKAGGKKKKSPPYALVIHLENLKRTVIELQEGYEVDRVATEMEIMFASRADDAIPSGVCDAGGRLTGKPQRPT